MGDDLNVTKMICDENNDHVEQNELGNKLSLQFSVDLIDFINDKVEIMRKDLDGDFVNATVANVLVNVVGNFILSNSNEEIQHAMLINILSHINKITNFFTIAIKHERENNNKH